MDKDRFRLSRRGMLAGAAVAAAGLGAATLSALNRAWFQAETPGKQSWWDRDVPVRLESAGYHEWGRHVGNDFTLHTEAGAASFRLSRLEPLPMKGALPEADRQQAFVAVFEAEADFRPAGDRIYTVEHEGATTELFFREANPELPLARLQAVFN